PERVAKSDRSVVVLGIQLEHEIERGLGLIVLSEVEHDIAEVAVCFLELRVELDGSSEADEGAGYVVLLKEQKPARVMQRCIVRTDLLALVEQEFCQGQTTLVLGCALHIKQTVERIGFDVVVVD